ncbi:restriction endonuclease subunit S [Anoxybacillus flavithermus]|uniref:Type I restriction-modification system specificity subunit S n=1 Tax=Anoxybacillus flavithermus TaxID=33934 RepID=A0A178THE4_9BACL|nr:restriction endonuclease subunit S [Anoxybacillus flavithermus]OAO80763.1 Type I restriction-modification system specificity subunit S [Anoxybacillus flavithermus]
MSDSIQVLSIGEVVEKIIGGGTPSREVKEYYKGNIPWFTVKDLTYHRLSKSQEYITESALENSSTNLIPRGNVIVATRIALGRAFINEVDAAINQDLKALIPNKRKITAEYLLYSILHKSNIIEKMGTGTTVKGIRLEQLKSLLIHVPPIKEQKKIASILSTVDRAIEKTEAIIEQTEKVKKGLMQQLLTKGIGHTKFKKSEIGEIPEEWEVKSIDELVFVNPESLSNKTNEEYEFEYIDIGSVERTGKIGETVRYQFKNSPSRARRIVRTGDTIISTVRPYLRAFAFIDNKHDQKVCSTGFAVLRPKEKIDPVFLFQSILNDKFVEFLKSRMTGSNYPAVTATDIKEYKLGVPRDINEQTKIAKILAKYDEKLEIEEKSLEQLQTIKKGLMQVLLTGKVRVKVDDEVMSQ